MPSESSRKGIKYTAILQTFLKRFPNGNDFHSVPKLLSLCVIVNNKHTHHRQVCQR